MVRIKDFFPDCHCPLIKRFCQSLFSQVTILFRQSVESRGSVGMIRAKDLIPDGKCALEQRLGLRIFAL